MKTNLYLIVVLILTLVVLTGSFILTAEATDYYTASAYWLIAIALIGTTAIGIEMVTKQNSTEC